MDFDKYNFEDERIRRSNDKINSEGFILLFFLLAVLILVRVVILNHPFESTWDIIALFLISSIYFTIRHMLKGDFYEEYEAFKNSKNFRIKTFITGLMAGVLFVIFNIIQEGLPNTMTDLIEVLINLIVFIVVFLGIDWLVKKVSHKKASEDIDDE